MAAKRICANRDCGAEFVPRNGRQLWCDACLENPEVARARARERKRAERRRERERKPSGPPRCERCGKALRRPEAPPLCRPCRDIAVKEELGRENGLPEKRCRACGEPFRPYWFRQVRCPECQAEERRRQRAAYMRKWLARRRAAR